MKLKESSRWDQKATRKGFAYAPEKRALNTPEPGAGPLQRLQRILSLAGVSSRRAAEELILLGKVKVNGQIVRELGTKAHMYDDVIEVEGKVLDLEATQKVYYALNKPRGYVTTTSDPQGRPTVMDLMEGVEQRVYPVGRLDYASEGILLFTNDGEMAHRLMHPSSQVPRTYAVKLESHIDNALLSRLKKGVQLSDAFIQPTYVGRGRELQTKDWVIITVTEGKNLEIRRVFAALGMEVNRLRRIAIGNLKIDKIPVGRYIPLHKRDLEEILQLSKKPSKAESKPEKR